VLRPHQHFEDQLLVLRDADHERVSTLKLRQLATDYGAEEPCTFIGSKVGKGFLNAMVKLLFLVVAV
jgi:hypothetical protein